MVAPNINIIIAIIINLTITIIMCSDYIPFSAKEWSFPFS